MEQENQHIVKVREEDEISLIDLFIVLVRRRRVILSMTVAAVAVALLVFYAMPALGKSSRYSITTEATFIPVQIPQAIRNTIGFDLP